MTSKMETLTTHVPLHDSKEVGLSIGLILGEGLFNMKDMHYGLWTEDIAVKLSNFSLAQERYSKFLLSHIPSDARTILDVGSGAGNLAKCLLESGYFVSCVSPSPFLSFRIRSLLGDRVTIFPTKFENLEVSNQFDVILFSESFQYVDPATSLTKAALILPEGKYVIISDFFSKRRDTDGPLGGGHNLSQFYKLLREHPFEIIDDIDITSKTSQTIEMFGQFLLNTVLPVKDIICQFVAHRHPLLSKFISWKFQKRFSKINKKYFSGELNSANFEKYKSYRLIKLKKLPKT